MLQCSPQASLSTQDRAVLDSLFAGSINYSHDHFTTFRSYSSRPNVQILKQQALECFQKKELEKSIKLLEQAETEDRNDPSVHLNIAIVQASISSDNPQRAIDLLTKAIALGTDTVVARSAYSLRSTLHESLGNVDEAREGVVMAAKMGDKTARDRLRKDNPYATMCDEVLRGAMSSYYRKQA